MNLETLPAAERPRQRLTSFGPEVLSVRELIAIILGSATSYRGSLGVAQDILKTLNMGLKHHADHGFWNWIRDGGQIPQVIKGLGPSGLARLVAASELARRYQARSDARRAKFNRPVCLSRLEAQALKSIPLARRNSPREWLGFIAVDRVGTLGWFVVLAEGSSAHVALDLRDLFSRLLRVDAAGLFLFHNHPDNSLQPSQEDRSLTSCVAALGKMLGIKFLGHWIITARGQRLIDFQILLTTYRSLIDPQDRDQPPSSSARRLPLRRCTHYALDEGRVYTQHYTNGIGMPLNFTWDEAKNIGNFAKHGIWFDEAQTVFADINALEMLDEPHSGDEEERFILLGFSTLPRLLIVVFSERNNTTVRIISARKATKREARDYEKRL